METPKPLSADTQAQIQSLAKRIAADADLDGSVTAELANHLEDKLNAYLAGTESLTEADALLLARHHFGNADTLRALIQNTRPTSGIFGQGQLTRRIAIAQAALFTAAIPGRLAVELWNRGAESHIVFSGDRSYTIASAAIFVICRTLVALLAPLFFLLLLRRSRKQSDDAAGLSLGHLRSKALRALLLYILLLTALAIFLPPMMRATVPQSIALLSSLISLAFPCVSALIWVRWCDRPPFTGSSLLRTLPAWVLTYITLEVCSFGSSLAQMAYFSGLNDLRREVGGVASFFSASLFLALIAAALYATVRRVHARIAHA